MLVWALFFIKHFPHRFPAGGSHTKTNIKMNKVTPYLMDATPGIAAASVSEIPNLDPYLQAIILVISGITALVRLWKSVRNKPGQEKQ